jgi:TonB family protein
VAWQYLILIKLVRNVNPDSFTCLSQAALMWGGDGRARQQPLAATAKCRFLAVVGFAISANGGLSLMKIVKSFSAATFDAAALKHIQGSAPFAPPPAGASARFRLSLLGGN